MDAAPLQQVLEATGFFPDGEPARGLQLAAKARERRGRVFSPDASWRSPSALKVYFKFEPSTPSDIVVGEWRREIWNEGFSPLLWIVSPDKIELFNGFGEPMESGDAEANRIATFRNIDSELRELDALAGQAAFDYIRAGIDLALQKRIRALVTAPINKEALRLAGIHYPGHTEILADFSGAKDFAMMLMNAELRVILVTIHVSLREAIEQSRFLMSEAEESLAADLALSGISAWSRLQGTVTSQVKVEFARDGKTETLPITALQNLSHDPDPDARRLAHEAELKAWTSVREPLAAAMNGVKGTIATLNKRRGRRDALHQPLDDARMDTATLEALLGAMSDWFPAFRKYLNAKAKRLGTESLAWWDLFAPVGGSERHYSWPETQAFVVEQFRTFSDRLAALAERAFKEGWIDAESRDGKRGGAFCMKVPAIKESRILCNFDGSLDQVFTVAHELGHGFHNDCLKDNTVLQNITPMTLAETASIFCETLMTEAALTKAAGPDEELVILEAFLQGTTQVIVDISSRFLFEREVFERRAEAELSADDFCAIMTRAQKATYGDALDERTLHPYMWAWKPHYYRAELQFYNFPYAFGLLFGLGLYAVYKQRGAAFVPDYENLLASTGLDSPANLAARFGIDLRDRKFWEDSLKVIERRIERYCQL